MFDRVGDISGFRSARSGGCSVKTAAKVAVLTEQPPDLADLNPEISPTLSNIVSHCLAKSREERFATVAGVVSALESVIQSRNLKQRGVLAIIRRPPVM